MICNICNKEKNELKHPGNTKFVNSGLSPSDVIALDHSDASCEFDHSDWLVDKTINVYSPVQLIFSFWMIRKLWCRFSLFYFLKKRLQIIGSLKIREKLTTVGWTFHDSNSSPSVKWVRHQKGISLHRHVYGFNNWIVVPLFPVWPLGICLKKVQNLFFFQKYRQKIDKGTRIYQVNCSVIFRKK